MGNMAMIGEDEYFGEIRSSKRMSPKKKKQYEERGQEKERK